MAKQKLTEAKPPKAPKKPKNNKSIEETLWDSVNKLRGSVEPSEYKHVVLGLIFLKYISDSFEELFAKLQADKTSRKDTPSTRTMSRFTR